MKSEGKCCRYNGVYSPQNYLYAVTGELFFLNGTDISSTIAEIEKILAEELPDTELWSHELSELEHIVENGLSVVLVQIDGFIGPDDDRMVTVYRWFEVPDDFVPEEDDDEESADISLKALDTFSED